MEYKNNIKEAFEGIMDIIINRMEYIEGNKN
jgi:hypothetical protein